MIQIGNKKIPLPGFRNIKTALSVLICILLYKFTGRNGLLFAVTASLICMQDSLDRSITSGLNRFLGTTIGGICGLLFLMLNKFNINYYIWVLMVCLGLVIIIYALNRWNKNDSIVMACFVYLVILLDPNVDEPMTYAINRIIDTSIGIIISVIVNHFLFRPEHDRQKSKNKHSNERNFKYHVKRNAKHKTYNWEGGIATELLIYPENSIFSERNFIWRLSLSTTDFRETIFAKFSGYVRHLMLVNGNIKIIQNNNIVNMSKFDSITLNGDDTVKCIGLCTDFNLMISKNYEGFLEKYHCFDKHTIKTFNLNNEAYETKLICSLFDDITLYVNIDENEKFEVILNKGDLFILENIDLVGDESCIIIKHDEKEAKDIVCLASSIRKKTTATTS